jgi:hypothetical protein
MVNLICDNVGLSSWNWVVLLDIFPGRPTFLAEDDPSDWIYYFQSRNESSSASASASSGGVDVDLLIKQSHSGGSGATSGGRDGNGGEKKCYLAPERFVKKEKKASVVSPATDDEFTIL